MLSLRRAFSTVSMLVFALCWTSIGFADTDTTWLRQYDGPASGNDYVVAMRVDTEGNAYVTGGSVANASRDYATVKYDTDGNVIWESRYEGPDGGDDEPKSLEVDDAGYVYVTGYSAGSSTSADYATVKYSPDGDTVWVRRYDGPDSGNDRAFALKVDAAGAVYVTGESDGGASRDYATIKYSADGITLWERRYAGPGGGLDQARAIQVDAFGNVYVTGYSEGAGTSRDYATVKYDADGDILWVRRYDGTASGDDQPYALQIDAGGNAYVTGISAGAGTSADIATVKYSADGDILWVRRYDGPDNGYEAANNLQLDAAGNVYVAGVGSNGAFSDYLTVKYDSDGNTLWVRYYDGPRSKSDWAYALNVDATGNVYVSGYSEGAGIFADCATIKYNVNGDLVWESRYDGPSGGEDYAVGLHADASGNVYVAGTSEDSETLNDFLTIKYSPCNCPYQSDYDRDAFITALDLGALIDVLFAGGTEDTDPGCPTSRGDFNNDGFPDALDLSGMIDHLFAGGAAPCDPCNPVQSTCAK